MKLEDLIRTTLQLPPDHVIDETLGPGQLDAWDSFGHLAIITALESTYGVAFGIDEVMILESVADIRRTLAQKGISGF